MMQHDPNIAAIFRLPECESFLSSASAPIGVFYIQETHCIGCAAKQLHNRIVYLTTDPMPIGCESLVFTKSSDC